jgi:hypothetical protein
VTVAQVIVDDAYWAFTIEPSAVVPRLGRATIDIPYPWVYTEPHIVRVITSTGLTFEGEVPIAVETPTPGVQQFSPTAWLGSLLASCRWSWVCCGSCPAPLGAQGAQRSPGPDDRDARLLADRHRPGGL